MKTIIRLTCLTMLLFAAATGWAETFKRGLKSCDFSVAENYYKQDPNDLSNQVWYARTRFYGCWATCMPTN